MWFEDEDNPFKPDGSYIPNAPGGSNIAAGAASVVTGLTEGLAATLDVGEGLNSFADDFVPIMSFALPASANREEPYPNILEEFASYTPLWTLACLDDNQFKDPYTYRGNPWALKNVIFSSAGRYDGQRVQTVVGAPEYFVNNFEIKHETAASKKTGLSNVIKMTFDVYEPYSMGYFLQSLLSAAIDSGYPSTIEAPFLLRLDFAGNKDDGSLLQGTKELTKYFVLRLTNITFNVTEGGSNYKVEAVPYNHSGWSKSAQQLTNDIALEGKDVVTMLSAGSKSLCAVLNKAQADLVKDGTQQFPDQYEIVFPVDQFDRVGLSGDDNYTPLDVAELLLDYFDEEIVVGDENPPTDGFGDGVIGQSSMGFSATSGGNMSFGFEADVVDDNGYIKRGELTVDPSKRTFNFSKGSTIQNVIQNTILSSEYAKDALDEKKFIDGRIKWFRVDVQIQLGPLDLKRNTKSKKYIFRVMPFYIHSSVFMSSTAVPAGMDKLNEIIGKEYNYIYTGQNTNVLKFDIQLNLLYSQGNTVKPPQKSGTIANKDTQQSGEDPGVTGSTEVSGTTAAVAVNGAAPLKGDPDAMQETTKGGYGAKTVEQIVAQTFQNAILNQGQPNGDLVNLNLEILGDPYWITDNGMGNYVGENYNGPGSQITGDGTMNYQGTDTYIRIIFRTPVEPDIWNGAVTTGRYFFAEEESPYSGIYKVRNVTSSFRDGAFKQTLECNRMPKQPKDFPNYTPPTRTTLPIKDDEEDTIETSPTDDVAESLDADLLNGDILISQDDYDQDNSDLNDFYG